jgi:hypothetical protein
MHVGFYYKKIMVLTQREYDKKIMVFTEVFSRSHTHNTVFYFFLLYIYVFFCGVTPGGDQDNGVNGAIIIKN